VTEIPFGKAPLDNHGTPVSFEVVVFRTIVDSF